MDLGDLVTTSCGDKDVDEVASILRLLHIRDLRTLQTQVRDIIYYLITWICDKFLTIFRLTSVSWPSRPSPPTPRQTRGWARLAGRRDSLQAQEERKIFEEKEKNI